MKYKLYTEDQIPLITPEGQVMSGDLCEFESRVPVNKGDRIILDPKDMASENLNVHELEVVKNPTHFIKEGQIIFSTLTVKKIALEIDKIT